MFYYSLQIEQIFSLNLWTFAGAKDKSFSANALNLAFNYPKAPQVKGDFPCLKVPKGTGSSLRQKLTYSTNHK